jgi:glutathione S-transferase
LNPHNGPHALRYPVTVLTCTKRVVTVLKETNTPFYFVDMDLMKGEQGPERARRAVVRSPDSVHRAYPLYTSLWFDTDVRRQEDDDAVCESRAVARYIVAKAQSPNLPASDARKAAPFERTTSVEISSFDSFAAVIIFQRVVTCVLGGMPNEARIAELTSTLDGKLTGYGAIISTQKYFAGNELTLTDLFRLPDGVLTASQSFTCEDETIFPLVAWCVSPLTPQIDLLIPYYSWWKDLTVRPSWQAVVFE